MRPELKASKRAIAKLLSSRKILNRLRKKNGLKPYDNYTIMLEGLNQLITEELERNKIGNYITEG
jgi:hypothetical protein